MPSSAVLARADENVLPQAHAVRGIGLGRPDGVGGRGGGHGHHLNIHATTLLALAPPGRQGQYQPASALLATVASTIPVGAARSAIAWFAPTLPGGLFAAIMSVGVAAGIAGAVIATQVTPAPIEDTAVPDPRVSSAVAA